MIEVVEKPAVGRPGRTRHGAAEETFRVIDGKAAGGASARRVDWVHAPATPTELLIGTLPHPRLRLRAPIRVEVQRESSDVGVWSPELEELGVGPHLSAAIEDFQRSVVELFFELEIEAAHDRLGPGMVALWRRLQGLVDVRP